LQHQPTSSNTTPPEVSQRKPPRGPDGSPSAVSSWTGPVIGPNIGGRVNPHPKANAGFGAVPKSDAQAEPVGSPAVACVGPSSGWVLIFRPQLSPFHRDPQLIITPTNVSSPVRFGDGLYHFLHPPH